MNDFVITEQHPVQRKLSQENKGNGPESTTTKSGDRTKCLSIIKPPWEKKQRF